MRYGREMAETPERKRKRTLITEALAKRGYKLQELHVGGGNWAAYAWEGPGNIEGFETGRSFDSFDELLHAFDDDLAFAQMVHFKLGASVRRSCDNAHSAYHAALDAYAFACKRQLRDSIEGTNELDAATRAEAVDATREAARKAYAYYLSEKQRRDGYLAAAPATQEAAIAYLASLPLIERRD